LKRRALLSSRFADSLSVTTAFAVAIPTLALVYFAEPVADDFVRAAVVDVRQYVRWTYSHWSGRWAAVGLEALLFSKLPLLSIYSAILWGLQVVHFLALLAFWHTVVGSTISLPGRLSLALGSYVFLLAGYSDPGQTVYWASGGIEYQLSVSLALFWSAPQLN
jgi:hypothetical protein